MMARSAIVFIAMAMGMALADLAPASPIAAAASTVLPALPEARSNNPAARLQGSSGTTWFTGLGIGPGKTWQDTRADGWFFRPGVDVDWRAVPGVPAYRGLAGRLGSHALTVGGNIYVIGGYTVAENHDERSTPGVYRLEIDPQAGWSRVTQMPVPVDDSVALVYRDRYVFLISGWSDTGNVNLVQVWDSRDHTWLQAEPWPGQAVFGHAGGGVGKRMLVCGGAGIRYPVEGPRQFVASEQCWLGTIRDDDLRRLDWRPVPAMPGGPRYRAGAVGLESAGVSRVVFAGGADRPYNYDGRGYDGNPAAALATVVSFNLDEHRWQCHQPMTEARMDLRALLESDGRLVMIGGMDRHREVGRSALYLDLSSPIACPVGLVNPTSYWRHLVTERVE
ncbi:MAG: hypothetical protein LC637_02395 [Xanthomonadaceae bacterium]|nr:hypothetical protein [Xanthomonadaceae bacterium]